MKNWKDLELAKNQKTVTEDDKAVTEQQLCELQSRINECKLNRSVQKTFLRKKEQLDKLKKQFPGVVSMRKTLL